MFILRKDVAAVNINRKNFRDLSRTKLLIINSLIGLMKTDDFKNITITQIIQDAEIARGTFYLNYKTKEEVILSFVEAMILDYDEKMNNEVNHTPYLMALNFFEYWLEYKEFAEMLQHHGLLYLLLETFETYMDQISPKWSPSTVFKMDEMTEKEIIYFGSFNSAGLWNMLVKWIRHGTNETPDEMARIYEKFMF